MNKDRLLKTAIAIFNPPLYFSHKHLEQKIQLLGQKIEAHIEEHAGGEPIPPNPETATREEIEIYKRRVHEAGNTPTGG